MSKASNRPAEKPLPAAAPTPASPEASEIGGPKTPEIGGPKGPEPTRYGDWERNGRCFDF